MTATPNTKKVLVMGVGNTLLQDDGIGVHVTESLKASYSTQDIDILDGGTIGLSLLPEIEDADAVIIIDASEIGERHLRCLPTKKKIKSKTKAIKG